jgi:hypothetical protein
VNWLEASRDLHEQPQPYSRHHSFLAQEACDIATRRNRISTDEWSAPIVILTWRLLQASRSAMSSTVAAPASISYSHYRAHEIALTSLTRVSAQIGRIFCPCVSRNEDVAMAPKRYR